MHIDTDIEITPQISNEIQQEFEKRLDKSYDLVYIDYRDSFNNSGEVIQQCIKNENADALYERMDNCFTDTIYEAACEAIEEIKNKILNDYSLEHLHPFIEEWLDTDDNKDDLRHTIEERDQSTPIKDMIKNTSLRARAMLYTNYDCLPHNYHMGNTYSYCEYVKDIIDVLYLNPALVKQKFIEFGIGAIGRFPNLSYRNGKEAVDYDDFANELLNQCSYGLLTFAGILPLGTLYEEHFRKITHITIPKGNNCGMFGDWNGGGSLMEMKLLRDLTIPIRRPNKTAHDTLSLIVDEPNINGYCIDEVYGMCRSFWGEKLKLSFVKEEVL